MQLHGPRRVVAAAVAVFLTVPVAAQLPTYAVAPRAEATPASTTPDACFGPTPVPDGKKVKFVFGMARRDGRAGAELRRVSDQASPSYGRWLSRGRIRDLGATDRTRARIERWFTRRGYKVSFDPARVLARVVGTAALWRETFGEQILRCSEPNSSMPGTIVRYPEARPQLPDRLSGYIKEKVWSNYRANPSTAGDFDLQPAAEGTKTGPKNKGKWLGRCKAAKQQRTAYSFRQVSKAYRSRRLLAVADHGKSPTVGIVTFDAGVDAPSMRVAGRCWGWPHRRTEIELSPGMPGPFPFNPEGGFSEPDLDAQMIRGFLPRAKIVNYQGWSDFEVWFLTLARVMADKRRPDVVSISFDACELNMLHGAGRVGRRLGDAYLMRLGLVGTTVLVASDDEGAHKCADQPKRVTMGWPAASPYVTAVGGTRLVVAKDNRRRREVVWNDSHYSDGTLDSSGGGSSRVYDRPWWQPRWMVGGSRRVVPDISVHASQFPGWPLVIKFDSGPLWGPALGTSAASPVAAAHLAALNLRRTRGGRVPLGFVNPLLYARRVQYPATFFDVTRGTNATPGFSGFRAKPGYDRATGLGVPDFLWWYRLDG